MSSSCSPISPHVIQGYYFLLVSCGIALLLSIPPSTHVAQLMEPHWEPPPQAFYMTYVIVTAILGLARGSAAPSWGRVGWRTVSSLALLVLFGQCLVLPHLLFSRALLPNKDIVPLLLFVYAALVGWMFSLVALRLELWGTARRTRPFLVQYAVLGLVLIAPWLLSLSEHVPRIVATFSPIGAALGIVHSAPSGEHAVAFGFVALMILLQLLGLRHPIRRAHAI